MSNIIFGQMLDFYRKQQGLTMEELGAKLGKTKSAVSRWVSGENSPKVEDIERIAMFFNVDVETLIFGANHHTAPTPVSEIHKTIELLQQKRQEKVLEYAKNQLEEQNKIVAFEIKENSKSYKAVETLAKLSAGRGYAYGDDVETDTYYTNRDDLKPYDVASVVHGDSMTPLYNNGDVVLIRNGYDNVNGAVYAVDYNGESYLKRVYFEGNRLRLVSVNHNYKDIYIYLPIEDGVFLNIIGKVVDSFTPVN